VPSLSLNVGSILQRAAVDEFYLTAIAHQVGCKETATFDRKLQGEKWFNYL